MNPARSLAPAIVSGNLQHLWIYLVAPVLGMLLAIPLFRVVGGTSNN
jgi:aquaporin Z